MAHPSIEELVAKFQAARKLGEVHRDDPEQLRLHRELAESCPAFTPNLLRLAWLMRLIDEPAVADDQAFAEMHRLLEQAVQSSQRGPRELVELAYFLDTFHDSPEAGKLFEEASTKALELLEEAWAGQLGFWARQRTKESLEKALELGRQASRLFPHSSRIDLELDSVRQYAREAGLLAPEQS